MINSIPTKGKVSIPNTSDIFGNIEYTKNIDCTEPGYIKLSSCVAYLLSQASDPNFALPLSFGRQLNDQFYMATENKSYIMNTLISNYFISADVGTNAPTATLYGGGVFWQSNWHVSDGTYIWIKNRITGNWSQAGSPILVFSFVGVSHMLEPFVSKQTLCAADGNLVHQISQAYDETTAAQLTLPADFEVTGISYSNYMMGIATKSSSILGSGWQNKEAVFFTWDGGSGNANGGYSIGADTILCVKAYKQSWVILTRRGRLMYFNGGGFDELARLPFNYRNRIWGDPIALKMYGQCIQVEDDQIYLNIPSQYNPFGTKGIQYMEQTPGGILCYNPNIGLYNRYCASNTLSILLNVGSPSLVDGTFTSNQFLPATGNPVKYVNDPTNIIGGLQYNVIYYMIRLTSTTFKLASSLANAQAGIGIIPTSGGASTNSFLALQVEDYGVAYTPGIGGGIGITGQHTVIHDHLLFGHEVMDGLTGNTYGVCCITLPDFKNIGYFVTSKMTSAQLEDYLQKVYLKYKPLKTTDSVVIKTKTEDGIGLPIMTPQFVGTTSWTAVNQITTTCDMSDAIAYLALNPDNVLECEIISGSGAGQMSQIVSLVPSGNSYIITLTDILDGAVAGNFCNVKIDNWKLLAPIDSTITPGYEGVAVETSSKWYRVKVILIGSNITIESVLPVSSTKVPAQ